MKKYLVSIVVVLIAAIALNACAAGSKTTPAATSEPTMTEIGKTTLRLAISDSQQDSKSEAILGAFIDQVNKLSNGTMTIEPTWDAGSATEVGFERGVIQLVREGKYDLGQAASRAWDSEGINAFQPLQAPFLIDNDALAEAVAKGDIGFRMLESLANSGITGLTLWPEDLRHPFSTIPDQPILSPADFAGRTIRVTSSMSEKLVEALGGTPMYGEGSYQGAESGLRQAATLSGRPIATGNVTFFPKYQVLFANGAAFDKLSEAQQSILRQAAATAQEKAIAEHPSEAEAAKTWCEEVNAVVLASEAQMAEFVAAAQPVFEMIEGNPQNAEMVAAIRELKAKTPPSPGAVACEAALAQPATTQAVDNGTWSAEMPPNGTWQATLTNDDVMKLGVSKAKAQEVSGVATHTFKDGIYHFEWLGTEGKQKGATAVCNGTYEPVKDYVTIKLDKDCGNEVDNVQWRLEDNGLHFHVLEIINGPSVEVTAMWEARPYQKVENWSGELPPNGTWQVTLTGDDVMKLGVTKARSAEWSGVFTHTFKDGIFHTEWLGTEGNQKGSTTSCNGTYKLVEDYVSILLDQDCNNEIDNIQWRLDDDGLHFHVVEIMNGPSVEVTAILEAKPYQKVDGEAANP